MALRRKKAGAATRRATHAIAAAACVCNNSGGVLQEPNPWGRVPIGLHLVLGAVSSVLRCVRGNNTGQQQRARIAHPAGFCGRDVPTG